MRQMRSLLLVASVIGASVSLVGCAERPGTKKDDKGDKAKDDKSDKAKDDKAKDDKAKDDKAKDDKAKE